MDKIGQGTVIFYTLFLSICALACLALLVWYPARWIWQKNRRVPSAASARPDWPTRMKGVFIVLAALVGLVLFAGLVKPLLVIDGPWLHPSSPYYVSFFLLSPYILLALTLVAALFTWLGWKGRTGRDRWIDIGKIALLATYALVVL
jgi:hypothetical protein